MKIRKLNESKYGTIYSAETKNGLPKEIEDILKKYKFNVSYSGDRAVLHYGIETPVGIMNYRFDFDYAGDLSAFAKDMIYKWESEPGETRATISNTVLTDIIDTLDDQLGAEKYFYPFEDDYCMAMWEVFKAADNYQRKTESLKKPLKESVSDEPKLFMNTWANYNENGAGSGITPTGWMSVDEAKDYADEYADYEPFINDTDNVPFRVSEYDNVEDVRDKLDKYESLDEQEREILKGLLENYSDDFDEMLEVVAGGDYWFIPDVSSNEDLVYGIIDALGGLEYAVCKDDIEMYFDYEMLGRDLGYDDYTDGFDEEERNELYEEGKISDPDYVNAGYYFCRDEDASDESIGEAYFDMVGGIAGISNPEVYFDYNSYGRDLWYDFTDIGCGAIRID